MSWRFWRISGNLPGVRGKIFPAALLAAALATATLPGCGAVAALLPKVVAVATDAIIIIDQIQRFVDRWFAASPDPERQKAVQAALDRSKVALDLALRISQGAEKVRDRQAEAAMAEFRRAYGDLLALVKPLGVRQVGSDEGLSAPPAALLVPRPLAFGSLE